MIYLYIKRHSLTGKQYFGKTTKDPFKYFWGLVPTGYVTLELTALSTLRPYV